MTVDAAFVDSSSATRYAAGSTRRNFLRRAAVSTGAATALATIGPSTLGSMAVAEAAVITSGAGVVQIDSFSGTNDDQKLTAALSYAAAQTFQPTLQFKAGVTKLGQSGRAPFSGMKLIGPYGPGPKNLELSSGKFTGGKVQLNVGNGSSAWFNGTGSLYDIYVGDCAFQYGSGGQFWQQATGTLYACQFHSLTHFGAQHVFGTPNAKALLTQVLFTGHWTVQGFTDVPFTMGGSDNELWVGGYLNIGRPPSTVGAKYTVVLSAMSKTNVGPIYITAQKEWRGLWVRYGSNGLIITGGRFEGMNANIPSNGSVVKVDGGIVTLRDCWFAYALNAPGSGEDGVIQVNGGNVLIDRPTYDRGNAAPTAPLVCGRGGKIEIRSAGGVSGVPVLRRAGGICVNDGSVSLA